MEASLRVVVTAATGNIAYSLLYNIATGEAFGELQPLILHLYDLPQYASELLGLEMELNDCVFPLLQEIVVTSDPAVAFKDVRCAFIMGGGAPEQWNERRSSATPSLSYFKHLATALDAHARKDVKVLVMGSFSNTCAWVCTHYAPSIPLENFSALMRLQQNRATAIMAAKMEVPPVSVDNMIIWGNCTQTSVPDASQGILNINKKRLKLPETFGEYKYMKEAFLRSVQNRESVIRANRNQATAMSLAKAACDHMRDWWLGTPPGQICSMAVLSDGSYNVPENIFFSYPVEVDVKGRWKIVKGLEMSSYTISNIQKSVEELMEEKLEAMSYCSPEDCGKLEAWLNRCRKLCPPSTH